MCEIDETGVTMNAANVGYRDALFMQSFNHGPNAKFGMRLAMEISSHPIAKVTAHIVLGISLFYHASID